MIGDYLSDSSFFKLVQLRDLLNKIMTNERMDQMFNDLGLDFSSIESTITGSINLDDSYCSIKNMTTKIDEVKN